MKLDKCIKKVCCFYASDWHLTVMLLPYINKKIEEKNKIYMKFEKSIEENFNVLLNKLDLKNKENISAIKWSQTVDEEDKCANEKIYIISGDDEYMDEKNKEIEEYYSNKDEEVRIINCYQVIDEKQTKDIINSNEYMYVLNTQGEYAL